MNTGNRAIIIGRGESEIQLYYNATYTTVSAILPIVVIFLGLLAADRFYKYNKNAATRYVALLICGVCCGASVTEMHYLGITYVDMLVCYTANAVTRQPGHYKLCNQKQP